MSQRHLRTLERSSSDMTIDFFDSKIQHSLPTLENSSPTNTIIVRKPIKVCRVPICINRVPIKLSFELKCMLKYKEAVEARRFFAIMDIVRYYESLMAKAKGKAGYSLLSRNNPEEHRNWKHFEAVYEICKLKDWDYRLYLQVQFDRGIACGDGIPRPVHLYSVRALKVFTNHLSTIKENYEGTLHQREKERGKDRKDLKSEIIDGIINSADNLTMYIIAEDEEQRANQKILRIYASWEEYSPFYLYSIPWFHQILDTLPEGKKLNQVRSIFNMVESSTKLKNLIQTTVQQAEEYFKLPGNLSL